MFASTARARNKRLEFRTPEEERALLARAVGAADVEPSTVVVREPAAAAREQLAYRDHFTLSDEARAEWERINRQPARDLPGLRRLVQRPWPFSK